MAQWQIKELADLTNVTVRTLHHYDEIGLLKPTIRQDNGYRIYTEKDLLKLQQILALKFFGFNLMQIEELLDHNKSFVDTFALQAKLLQEKAAMITKASKTLQKIITISNDSQEIVWEKIIESIKVFKNLEQVESSWAGEILNAQEIKDYAEFKEDLKKRYTPEEKKQFEDTWHALVEEIRVHIDDDPSGPVAISIAQRSLELLISFYGKKYAHLRRAIWKKGFRTNKISGRHALTPEMVAWLDIAMYTYYGMKIYKILMQIETNVKPAIQQAWDDLIDEMCGNSKIVRQRIINKALSYDSVNSVARNWLKSL